MESYRATGIPNSGSQRGYTQSSRISRPSSNGAGSYGLSIRVQGIDGHPYVVLNNQDRGHQPDSNGYLDTESSFIENYQEYDFRGDKEAGSSDPFMEYRTQKMRHYSGPQNGLPESQATKPSTLLNFQRHPELLQPYDPRTNSLNIEGFHSLPSRPEPQADTRIEYQNPYPKSEVQKDLKPSRFRSSSLDRHLDRTEQENRQPPQTDLNTPKMKSPSLPPVQVPQPQSRTPSQPTQPQIKPYLTSLNPSQPKPTSKTPPVPAAQPQPSPMSSPPSDQRKESPTSTRSANSSLERTHHDPDVLPLRRTDSGEPIQSSSRSRQSSLSSTSKSLIDEQMEALYTDAINRHENRRYIPFQPGSGRDIDTGSIPAVDELIDKFDGKDGGQQRRGRAGRRNRINPEDRKRSRSVDSAFGSRSDSSFMDEFGQSRGTSKEHVLRPSQLRLQRTASGQDPWSTAVDGPSSQAISAPGSPQSSVSKYIGSLRGYTKLQSRPAIPSFKSSEEAPSSVGKVSTASLSKLPPTADSKTSTGADVQATPDLLKGQQELSQQTHEETAKQILFSYLKEGSNDNDDLTNKKVNLVFEKIQTLKSRATASAQGDSKSVDLAAQTKALQEQNAELEKEIIELKRQLEEQMKKSQADRRAVAGLKELQQELQRSLDECRQLKEKLAKTESELNSSVEELFQVKMEREQCQTEIRDLQDQLSEMHDELDGAKRAAADGEKDVLMADMMQLKVEMQEVVIAKEELEELLRRRERELAALKGALKDEVAAHDQEVDKMKEQYEKEISRLQTSLEEAKQNSAAVVREKAEVEAAKGQAEGQAGRLNQEIERLRRRTNELENEVAKLNRIIDEAKLLESRLGDKAGRLEREKRQLEESLAEIREQEEEMSRANRMLNIRLEDVQKNLAKLDLENKDLVDRLQEEKSQKEQFKNMKNNIEDERRVLDRTVEKLQREMSDIVEASQSSTRELQEQIDIYKEKNRRELAELQRHLKEKGQELDKLVPTTRNLQEQLSLREDELRRCKTERDEAVLKEQTLEKKVHDLEMEAQKNKQTKDDKSRQMKLMENRISQLELDLEEERQSGDQLMDRIDRGREQVEQMRNELLQERSSRQDLECDKLALERQNKDLKSRVAHLEGSHQSNKGSLVNELEARVQELEEKLEEEEREKSNLSLANRRLERRVKEMMMQIEEEHHTMQDQKDQLNLRLKALKRQMDEAEETIDRLEHNKKKLHRELDEQQEANEQLNSQLKALRSEMRRKNTSAPLLNNLDDDDDDNDLSTDGEMYFSSSGYKRSSSQDNSLSGFGL
ncbi:cingulin-like protein 1 isoform X2 [Poecilia reticulata]|uniref:cingulin-like protein 1 isoform X2 n=1 Tax=Poecilia reticulata TaxID=8081 RepID=UPI0004A367B6|nr:PREDICTED: cingulin-like protein 1 isoform X2 [Poecilia reticulata]